jgi:hypothetical protein
VRAAAAAVVGVVVVAAGGADGSSSAASMEHSMSVAKRKFDCARAWRRALTMAVVVGATCLCALDVDAAGVAQRTFASPDAAASALVDAVKAQDRKATLAVLGDAADWISSGDKVADQADAARFVAAYDAKHSIVRDGDKATLTLGDDEFPFAFPLVASGGQWRFDTAEGKRELLSRRIGGNELTTITVLQAIVDAEADYASADRRGDGVMQYALRFASTPGKRDGLYWDTKAGETPSPLGVLVADAAGQGYRSGDAAPTPFHGYYFRMLKGQGRNAAGGAFDYVVHGRAIAGFAVIAYPARYGNSGIMTFVVNQDGKIYQSDLGPDTKVRAEKVQRFDPGKGWSTVAAK